MAEARDYYVGHDLRKLKMSPLFVVAMSAFLSEPLFLFQAWNTPHCLISCRLPVLCPGLLPLVLLGLLANLMMRLMSLNMFLMEVFSF